MAWISCSDDGRLQQNIVYTGNIQHLFEGPIIASVPGTANQNKCSNSSAYESNCKINTNTLSHKCDDTVLILAELVVLVISYRII